MVQCSGEKRPRQSGKMQRRARQMEWGAKLLIKSNGRGPLGKLGRDMWSEGTGGMEWAAFDGANDVAMQALKHVQDLGNDPKTSNDLALRAYEQLQAEYGKMPEATAAMTGLKRDMATATATKKEDRITDKSWYDSANRFLEKTFGKQTVDGGFIIDPDMLETYENAKLRLDALKASGMGANEASVVAAREARAEADEEKFRQTTTSPKTGKDYMARKNLSWRGGK